MDKNVNENGKSSHKKVWHKTGFIVKDKKPQNVPKQWTWGRWMEVGDYTRYIYTCPMCKYGTGNWSPLPALLALAPPPSTHPLLRVRRHPYIHRPPSCTHSPDCSRRHPYPDLLRVRRHPYTLLNPRHPYTLPGTGPAAMHTPTCY